MPSRSSEQRWSKEERGPEQDSLRSYHLVLTRGPHSVPLPWRHGYVPSSHSSAQFSIKKKNQYLTEKFQ